MMNSLSIDDIDKFKEMFQMFDKVRQGQDNCKFGDQCHEIFTPPPPLPPNVFFSKLIHLGY